MQRWKQMVMRLLFPKWWVAVLSVPIAAALVSMLALETAMLSQFGEENSASFRKIMTGCTGAGVCMIILSIAFYMIFRATKELNREETV